MLSRLNFQLWHLCTFVKQTVTISQKKVIPESESLKFPPTLQAENPFASSTPTPQPCLFNVVITTSYNHARSVDSTALPFSLPFALLKAYC